MQPSSHSRPVMDVTAPPRPAVSAAPATPPPSPRPESETAPRPEPTTEVPQSLPVQQAPDVPEETPEEQTQPDNTASTESSPDASPPVEQERITPTHQAAQPKNAAPLPVGAIVMTVLIMIALSALAVMIYLKTQ